MAECREAEKVKKRAWIYCSIDAPEDSKGALQKQFKRLVDYAEQMEFELVGSSSDIGGEPLMRREGFQNFVEAVKEGRAGVLLVDSRRCFPSPRYSLCRRGHWRRSTRLRFIRRQKGESICWPIKYKRRHFYNRER